MDNEKMLELNDEQMDDVSGGEMESLVSHPMAYKRCAVNPEHVFVGIHDKCPICGCQEFTSA